MKKFTVFHEDENVQMDLIKPGAASLKYMGAGKLPLNCPPYLRAGELGWDLVMPETFTVEWDGREGAGGIKISSPQNKDHMYFVNAFAANGQIVIKIPYLFQIEPGNFLWLKAPTNSPISMDLYPVEGLVEYDWFPAHAAMHYMITTPNKVITLEKGQPYCRIIPYPKEYIESFKPEYKNLEEDPSFFKRLMRFIRVDKMNHRSPRHLKSYSFGFDGEKDVPHVDKISLESPGELSKCPFHKLFRK